MTKHIPKKARKGVTRDRARELDVKALARSAGLNFDGVALTSAGLVLLADSAGAAPLTKAPAEHGHPRGGKDQLASSTTSSTTSDGASAATRSPGHDVAAAAAVTKPVALDQSGHPFAGVSGSGTSQSLIDSLIARETEAPLPGDATSTSEASTEAVSGSGTIATSGESLVVARPAPPPPPASPRRSTSPPRPSMKAPASTTCSPPRCRPPRTASPPSTPIRATSPLPTGRPPARSPSPPTTARTSTATPPA